jgi:hypothetical protein
MMGLGMAQENSNRIPIGAVDLTLNRKSTGNQIKALILVSLFITVKTVNENSLFLK